VQFDESTVARLATEIWSSMLGIELSEANGAMAHLGRDRTLTGCVQITGDWTGAVTVRCPTALARTFASVMFDRRDETVALDDVLDALAELTNMTGGGIKGLVPGSCQLGIPAVAEGLDYTLAIPKGRPIVTVGLEQAGGAIEIVVYETV
jgi:chemotaxis protein CheX